MSIRIGEHLPMRQIGGCLALILAVQTAQAAAAPWQDVAPAPQEQSAPIDGTAGSGTDNGNGKPSVDSARPGAALPDAPEVAQSAAPNANGQNGSSQPSQDQQQNGGAQPLGTAVAPGEPSTGVAASKPAGAAIAPAKQRRVRTILISLGVIAAACVAIGTIAGLSHTSPSQPK